MTATRIARFARASPEAGAAFTEAAVAEGDPRALCVHATIGKAEVAIGEGGAVAAQRAWGSVGAIGRADPGAAHARCTGGVTVTAAAHGRRSRGATHRPRQIGDARRACGAHIGVCGALASACALAAGAGGAVHIGDTRPVVGGRAPGGAEPLAALEQADAGVSTVGAPSAAPLTEIHRGPANADSVVAAVDVGAHVAAAPTAAHSRRARSAVGATRLAKAGPSGGAHRLSVKR
jgi:hypothetical protein